MEVALALVAAILFAFGTVLQQRVAVTATDEEAAKAGFLLQLARKPQWLVGIATDGGGLVCQAWALAVGRLVVVQPILAASLVFALPIGARLSNRRVSRRQFLAALTVAGGLAIFLVVANPGGGRPDATTKAWLVSIAICAVCCAPLAALGWRARPALKAALIGAAAGILFGLCAALIKSTVERFHGGVWHVVLDWHIWALVVIGYVSMALGQTSLQAGRLAPAIATQTALDPVTSVVLGVLAFDEGIHTSTLGVIAALAGIAVMIGGIVALAGTQRQPQGAAAPS
jgi:drug/metabolite transporter (DMT)-like permease